jgi:uncharacterized membrane protein YeaQ/YmgE (transglycosylase-associated protein family)
MKTKHLLIPIFVLTVNCLLIRTAFGADEPGMTDKAKELARETSTAVENAGNSAVKGAKNFWTQIDAARLKNRSRDEIVAWVIMGVLVGLVAGSMTTLKPTGLGKVGRLFLGLAGACLGGMVVHIGKFDFGWGPVLIRYEELLFSLLGAILLVLLGKMIRSRSVKKSSA